MGMIIPRTISATPGELVILIGSFNLHPILLAGMQLLLVSLMLDL